MADDLIDWTLVRDLPSAAWSATSVKKRSAQLGDQSLAERFCAAGGRVCCNSGDQT